MYKSSLYSYNYNFIVFKLVIPCVNMTIAASTCDNASDSEALHKKVCHEKKQFHITCSFWKQVAHTGKIRAESELMQLGKHKVADKSCNSD